MKFRNTETGHIVELDKDAAQLFGGLFAPVADDTPLTGGEPCCGMGRDDDDEDDFGMVSLAPKRKK